MNIDRSTANSLSDECELALQAVAAKHGLELVRKSGSFGPTELTMKFQLRSTETDDSGVQITSESRTFKNLAHAYGMSPDDLGREFSTHQGRYKITGLVTRRRKYPIQATCVATGRGYKFPAESVKMALTRESE